MKKDNKKKAKSSGKPAKKAKKPEEKAVSSATALPKPSPKARTNDPETARRRLISRYGYEEDELKVLFKTDEELLDFYNNKAGRKETSEEDAEIGWDSEDSWDVPPVEAERMRKEEIDHQRKRFAATTPQSDAKTNKADATAEEAKPKVSFEEFLQAGEDLKQLLGEAAETDTPEKEGNAHE